MTKNSQLNKTSLVGWSIRVRGTVQGVGFRPTVFKLALDHGVTGKVLNDGDGVVIEAWGSEQQLIYFKQAIRDNAPPLAHIEQIVHSKINGGEPLEGFSIAESESSSAQTNIAADAATCAACIEDVFSPFNRRFRYPFTNCTDCGPRLSIIQSIPYDRKATSMSVFKMCDDCQKSITILLTDASTHNQTPAMPAVLKPGWSAVTATQSV